MSRPPDISTKAPLLSHWEEVLLSGMEGLPVPSLAAGATHVWQASAALPRAGLNKALTWLSPDELARACRFKFQAGYEQFIASHGLLRLILAAYIGEKPAGLRFTANHYGKPQISRPDASGVLNFNMSHSGSKALFAVSRTFAVGVDVELVVAGYPWEDIVRQFFSYREKEYLHSVPQARRAKAFFSIWTCKEAYWKAKGIGLNGLAADETVLAEAAIDPIQLARLTIEPKYRGAVAVAGAGNIRCFRLVTNSNGTNFPGR